MIVAELLVTLAWILEITGGAGTTAVVTKVELVDVPVPVELAETTS